ncbi:YidH family protein [Methylocaldum sp. MU1018]
MIKNFTDHSANERTYLAWIRTAIAVIAFGFLIERFDLFLAYIAGALPEKLPAVPSAHHEALILGLGLVILGIVLMVAATLRFILIEKEIAREDRRRPPGILAAVGFAALLFLFSLSLLGYLIRFLWT